LSAPRGEEGRITVQDRRALVLTRLVAGKVDEAEAALPAAAVEGNRTSVR